MIVEENLSKISIIQIDYMKISLCNIESQKVHSFIVRDITKEVCKINKELVNTPGEKQKKKIQIANKYMK